MKTQGHSPTARNGSPDGITRRATYRSGTEFDSGGQTQQAAVQTGNIFVVRLQSKTEHGKSAAQVQTDGDLWMNREPRPEQYEQVHRRGKGGPRFDPIFALAVAENTGGFDGRGNSKREGISRKHSKPSASF